MNVGKLLRLLLVLVILAVAWKEGWPRLKRVVWSTGRSAAATVEGEGNAEHCVREAAKVAQDFGDGVSRYGRNRADHSEWLKFAGRIQRRVETDRNLCACPGEACSRATAALVQLASLLQRTDDMVRGSTDEIFNPATEMEEIYDKLDQAKSRLHDSPDGG